MAQDLISIRYTNMDGLLNTGVSDFLMLNNECSALKNVWVTKIGKLEKVPGYSDCTVSIVSLSPSVSLSVSPSISLSRSPSVSPSISPSVSPPDSYSPSISTSISPSISASLSPSRSPSISISISPSRSPSLSPSVSPSISASASPPNSYSPSASVSLSPSRSPSISSSLSPSLSPSVIPSGSQVVDGNSVNFLHYYYDTSNRINYLFATSNDGSNLTLRYRTTGSFGNILGLDSSWNGYANSQPDIENYLNRAFIVGYQSGNTFLPNATVNGISFSTTDSNIENMPQGKFIVRYRDLLYVLHAKTGGNVYPTRAYYSDEPTANTISWTNLTTNFIEFGYDDGDDITGGAECLDRLIVFKTNSMWKYDESSAEQIADTGCDSNRSIQKINKILYWYNRDGFWRWRGSQPELISAKAQPFIDAMDQSTLTSVIASSYNGFEYRAFIGTITVEGITYVNAWFCWDVRREKCYIRCTAHPGKSACLYVENGKRRTYFGDNDGYVYKFATKVDQVYDDAGEEIDSFFITKSLDYGVPESTKIVNRMNTFTQYAAGMKVAVETDGSTVFNESNKQIKKNIDELRLVANAKRFRYKFYEKGKGKSWSFEGFIIKTKVIDAWD